MNTSDHKSSITLIVGSILISATLVVFALIVISYLRQDKWESRNAIQIMSKLENAKLLQSKDPIAAYTIYSEVLDEASKHKLSNAELVKALGDAELSKTTLFPRVEKHFQAIRSAEQQKVAEEQSRKQKEIDDERLRKEEQEIRKQEDEKQRQNEIEAKTKVAHAATAYKSIPQSARDVLNELKKVEARLDVGVTFAEYSKAIGDAWGEVKIFTESRDGAAMPEFSELLVDVVSKHKFALEVWSGNIRGIDGHRLHEGLSDGVRSLCWNLTKSRLLTAEKLLEPLTVVESLLKTQEYSKNRSECDSELRSLLSSLWIASLVKELLDLDQNNEDYRKKYKEALAPVHKSLDLIEKLEPSKPK